MKREQRAERISSSRARLRPTGTVTAVAAAATLLLAACGATHNASPSSTSPSSTSPSSTSPSSTSPTPSKTKGTIALINGDNQDPFFLSIWRGAKTEASDLGYKLVEEAPATFSYADQVPLLNDMITQHVSAILLSPDSGHALRPEIASATKNKIPVAVVNATEAVTNYRPYVISYIGSSNLTLGKLAAEYMGNLIHGKGTVGVLDSVAGSRGDLHRATGFIAEMHSKYPGVKTLPIQYSDDSRTKADSIATDLMIAHPHLAGIYAVDSFTGQGVGTAVKSANKVGIVKVVAVDAEPQEVALMREHVIQGLVAQRPYEMGQLGVRYLYDYLTGKKSAIKLSVITTPVVVTPSNVDTPAMKKVVYSSSAP